MTGEPNQRLARRRPTLEDVARLAAVSMSTASRVVNDHASVNPRTRAAVETAVATLGYRPSFVGRTLALRRSRTIGVIVSDIRNPFFPELVHAVEVEAGQQEYLPILCDVGEQSAEAYTNRLIDHGVDGFLVASASTRDLSLPRLRAQGLPVVLVNSRHSEFSDSFVMPDYRAGGAVATRHLLALGHEHVGHIRGPLSVTASIERERGYLDALEEAGIEYVRILQARDFSPAAGREAVRQLMQLRDKPTAIFAVNDYCAIGVLHGLTDLGLRVPEDVAVVGYDDIWLAALPSIALTTVSSRIGEMGALGARMLISLIDEQRTEATPIVLQPELVVRTTTARA